MDICFAMKYYMCSDVLMLRWVMFICVTTTDCFAMKFLFFCEDCLYGDYVCVILVCINAC